MHAMKCKIVSIEPWPNNKMF